MLDIVPLELVAPPPPPDAVPEHGRDEGYVSSIWKCHSAALNVLKMNPIRPGTVVSESVAYI